MRHLFRIVLLVLVLMMVFLVSALTSMRVAIHGREVAVPKLTGMTPAEAERTAVANGLLLHVESRYYSSAVPEGHILQQLPPPGTKVRRGWRVHVTESLGPQRVTIPDVIGQSQRAAEINLTRRGLEMGTIAVAHLPGMPSEQVVAQSPPPNSEGAASPKINLLLSAPAEAETAPVYVMPNFVGHTLAEASLAITDGKFTLGTVRVATSGGDTPGPAMPPRPTKAAPGDLVTKQSPAAGQKIAAGATINLEVAKPQ